MRPRTPPSHGRWPLVIDEALSLYRHALLQGPDQSALHMACRSAATAAAAQGARS